MRSIGILVVILFVLLPGLLFAQEEEVDIHPLLAEPQEGWYFSREDGSIMYLPPEGGEAIVVGQHERYLFSLSQVGDDIYYITGDIFNKDLYRNGELVLAVDAFDATVQVNNDMVVLYLEGQFFWWPLESDEYLLEGASFFEVEQQVQWFRLPASGKYVAIDSPDLLGVYSIDDGGFVVAQPGVQDFALGETFSDLVVTSESGLYLYDSGEFVRFADDTTADNFVFCGDYVYFDSSASVRRSIWRYSLVDDALQQLTGIGVSVGGDVRPVCGPEPEVPMFFSNREDPSAQFGISIFRFYELPDLNARAVEVSEEMFTTRGIDSIPRVVYYQ